MCYLFKMVWDFKINYFEMYDKFFLIFFKFICIIDIDDIILNILNYNMLMLFM